MENYDNQRTFTYDDDNVVVIIGSGAGGGTLAHELAQKGIDAVVLEAGKLHTRNEFIADEWASFGQLAWLDNRTTSGTWRVARDFPNLPSWIVKAVGGSTVHWAGASLRFQPHEFRAASEYGDVPGANLLDWPLEYDDLAPYYDRAEDKMGVTRTNGIPGLPGNNNFKVMHAGATAIGYENVHTGNMAINSQPRDGRAACVQRGFCFQGCATGAKWSTLFSEIPRALATGHVELRPESQVASIEHDDRGRVNAVVYFDADGNEQRQRARAVAVAGNSIETPRMLLNSATGQFPDGLANSSGQVGRNYMRHMTGSVYASFEEPVHMYKGTTMAGIVQDEAHHDPSRGFAGGYEIETVSLGLPFMAAFFDPGAWGPDFTEAMDQYAHMAGMWLVGEDMPQQRNRVTLNTDVKDSYGLPVPNVHYDDHPNDVAMRQHAFQQGIAIYEAAGAKKAYRTPPYPSTHNLGTCRMSARARDGVCNGYGQSHDIDNLFISDGSQFTTSAAENPTLTIVSLAIRQADYIAQQMADRVI
ncbi:2-keto-gluconate dehydrogenase [Spiribacter curvatus]|uniref:2-keto-gluconate dehydrogenase n=1 Tax=Spiribacter curvatus TaxID=1335757 RepID=U5T727_9GAMM|nr:GMC family oxidoreductase [Spiribacter curvatus]AGY92037.1 2-keto-gluconate dehydrogenase [Spiribacter curvatus]